MKPCPNRLQEALPRRPVNGLNIEIGTPAARCKLKTPAEWAGREPKEGLSLADRWLRSGGSCLVFGHCEGCQGLDSESQEDDMITVRGARDAKKIAKRKTYDGKTVIFWSDGGVTSGMGGVPRGTSGVVHRDIQNWLMGDVSLFDWDELPIVIQMARKLHKKNPNARPGDYRAFVEKKLGPPKL